MSTPDTYTDQFVLFFSADSAFSNWSPIGFRWAEQSFDNAEAAMMWSKARLFDDARIATQILANQKPRTVKTLGRQVSGFDQTVWDRHKDNLAVSYLLAKFSQNEALRQQILAVGDRRFVEASPFDRIWGIGLRASDPRALDPAQWRGENRLGAALDRVKALLAGYPGMVYDGRRREATEQGVL